MKRIILLALALLSLCLAACSSPVPSPSAGASVSASANADEGGDDMDKNPVVTIEMESGKKIVLELYPDKAPNTVANFVSLAQDGFYDGLKFHRVAKGFMIQGGDPEGTGMGGPGYNIKGEFANNGYTDNDISHLPGVISMARSSSPDSAGSQFFICSGDASFLDGDYAAFGKVTEGQDVVDEIAALNTNPNGGPPSTPQVIKSITVDMFGKEFGKPETIK